MRRIIAVGPPAIHQAAEILASTLAGKVPPRRDLPLQPGAQWGGDRMLLSSSARTVRFVSGSALCEQDLEGFLVAERPAATTPGTRKAGWELGLSRYEISFCLYLAAALSPGWESHQPVCAFLDRFANFYRNHRTRLELATRELHLVLDGLFAVRQWPGLFQVIADAMGEQAAVSLPRGVAPADVASFLGRLLIGEGPSAISLAPLPELLHTLREMPTGPAVACLRVPHYRRILETLENSTARVAPLIDQLRANLQN